MGVGKHLVGPGQSQSRDGKAGLGKKPVARRPRMDRWEPAVRHHQSDGLSPPEAATTMSLVRSKALTSPVEDLAPLPHTTHPSLKDQGVDQCARPVLGQRSLRAAMHLQKLSSYCPHAQDPKPELRHPWSLQSGQPMKAEPPPLRLMRAG